MIRGYFNRKGVIHHETPRNTRWRLRWNENSAKATSSNQLPDDVQVTLIDKVPYHCFKTEYYALVAGTISETHIRIPFPEHPRLNIQYGTITNIDLEEKLFISMAAKQSNMMT